MQDFCPRCDTVESTKSFYNYSSGRIIMLFVCVCLVFFISTYSNASKPQTSVHLLRQRYFVYSLQECYWERCRGIVTLQGDDTTAITATMAGFFFVGTQKLHKRGVIAEFPHALMTYRDNYAVWSVSFSGTKAIENYHRPSIRFTSVRIHQNSFVISSWSVYVMFPWQPRGNHLWSLRIESGRSIEPPRVSEQQTAVPHHRWK